MKTENIFLRFCIYVFIVFTIINVEAQTVIDVPKIRFTSINTANENIEIRWNPSSTPGVQYYKVQYYHKTGPSTGGWDLVSNDVINAGDDLFVSFHPSVLLEADPLQEPVMFSIQAFIDEDNSSSLAVSFDSTIYLQAEYDTCLASVKLWWNKYDYIMWPQPGTGEYQIYFSNNGGINYNLHSSIPSYPNNIEITGLLANNDYLFYVSAVSENNTGDVTNSNTIVINTNMEVLPEYMHANYATFENGKAKVSFSIDPLSETITYNLLRAFSPNSSYDSIYQFVTTEKELIYSDNINYLSGPYYYKLDVINNCKHNIRSSENIASTIVLNKSGSSLSPQLNWNEYLEWQNGVDNYLIKRKFGNDDYGQPILISATNYTDTEIETLVEHNYAASVCYRITAIENGGSNSSISNDICFELPVNIRFEFDAFMPGSGTGNDSFGPTIDFTPDQYTFKILDRSGRKVYESKDPENTRWNGYINGSLAPQGAYMAIIQYQIGDSKKHTLHGAVAVVY